MLKERNNFIARHIKKRKDENKEEIYEMIGTVDTHKWEINDSLQSVIDFYDNKGENMTKEEMLCIDVLFAEIHALFQEAEKILKI